MKKLLPILLLAAGLLLAFNPMAANAASTSAAPDATPKPPAPPLVRRVPDLTEWGITYSVEGSSTSSGGESDKEKAKKAAPLETKTVLKGGGAFLEITARKGATPVQMWWLPGGVKLRSTDGVKWLVGAAAQPGFDTADYSSQDFAGLAWISAQNYKGEVDYKGKKCFLFQDKVVTTEANQLEAIRSSLDRSFNTVTADENGNVTVKVGVHPEFHIDDFKTDVYAYIDQETRLPVAVIYKSQEGLVTRSYIFQKLQAMPPLPAEVHKTLDAFKQRKKSLSVPHAPI